MFGPSDLFRLRSKVVLHIEDYTWALVSWSFYKLRKVGVSFYLKLQFVSVFCGCFGWFEVLNDRLIGPKIWDQIVGIFRAHFGQSMIVHGLFGLLGLCLVL